MDINTLSLPELIDLRDRVISLIDVRKIEMREKTAADFHAIAAERGLTLDEVLSLDKRSKFGKKTLRMTSSRVKYRHPDNPDLVWVGSGRKPSWLKEWEESGKSIDLTRVPG
ncbi:MAG TPA: H-NS histone family protein [Rhodocyclaceae bacterium]|nr:H-NS histone family protein [Rhodocyclaceae bacterium]